SDRSNTLHMTGSVTKPSAPPPPPAPGGGSRGGGGGAVRSPSGSVITHDVTSPRGTTGYSIVVQSRGLSDANLLRGSTTPTTPWILVLQHTAGSLDAAVSNARRRNLWISFGILTVLIAGLGIVVVNAQRSQRLAAQQMDFVATVTHELRTPLAVIRSAAQ